MGSLSSENLNLGANSVGSLSPELGSLSPVWVGSLSSELGSLSSELGSLSSELDTFSLEGVVDYSVICGRSGRPLSLCWCMFTSFPGMFVALSAVGFSPVTNVDP